MLSRIDDDRAARLSRGEVDLFTAKGGIDLPRTGLGLGLGSDATSETQGGGDGGGSGYRFTAAK